MKTEELESDSDKLGRYSEETMKKVFRIAFSPKEAWDSATCTQRRQLLRLWFKNSLQVSKNQNGFLNRSKVL